MKGVSINHEISSSRGERDHRVVVLLLLGVMLLVTGQVGEGAVIPFFSWFQSPKRLAVFQSILDHEGSPRLLLNKDVQEERASAPLVSPSPLPAALTPFFFQPIPLNEADLALLVTVPGIGPVLAERIIARRAALGRFQSLEDLLSVSGIGKKKLENMRKHIRI